MSEPGCLYYKTEAGDVVPVARLPKVILQPPSPAQSSGEVIVAGINGPDPAITTTTQILNLARTSQVDADTFGIDGGHVLIKQPGTYLVTASLLILGAEHISGDYLICDTQVSTNGGVGWGAPVVFRHPHRGTWSTAEFGTAPIQLGDDISPANPARIRARVTDTADGGRLLGAGDVALRVVRLIRDIEGIKGDKGDPGELTLAEANARFAPIPTWFSVVAAIAGGTAAAGKVLAEVIIPAAPAGRMVTAVQRGFLDVRHRVDFVNISDALTGGGASFIIESTSSGSTRVGFLPANTQGIVRTVAHVAGTVNQFAGDINFFGLHVSAWG